VNVGNCKMQIANCQLPFLILQFAFSSSASSAPLREIIFNFSLFNLSLLTLRLRGRLGVPVGERRN
jgi:hypothetical protein